MKYSVFRKIINRNKLYTVYGIRYTDPKGFTLIETLVAITLLTVAIAAPMTLTVQSLSSAYYARDQIVAFHLAQEAIESVRHVRDGNILRIALGQNVEILSGIPSTSGDAFIIDGRTGIMTDCPDGGCRRLTDESGLYGYGSGPETKFRRSVRALTVPNNADEVRIEVTVSWPAASGEKTFTLTTNMFEWVNIGTGIQ